jgi:iron complex outermembrane receptor protein
MHKVVVNLLGCLIVSASLAAQSAGTLRGSVTLKETGEGLHSATVLIVQLGRSEHTGEDGKYEFRQVPPGTYRVIARLHNTLTDEAQTVTITAGQVAQADFALRLAPLKQEITVTATGREETVLESFQSVKSLDSDDLATRTAASLGEVLQNQPGVASRSFGPGASRPVVRGFDGDRVLVMQDGINSGTLSSQSGDHGEIVDASSLERIEVVRGPATLLYGSNAVGGVVNAITSEHELHEHARPGLTGQFTGTGGSANAYGGGSGSFLYGGRHWLLSGGGGGLRTGDYQSPLGTVLNSDTRTRHAAIGVGWYSERAFFNFGYKYSDSRYGIPFDASDPGAERVALRLHRHNVRFTSGVKSLGKFVDNIRLTLNYSDYQHQELELEDGGIETAVTAFFNKALNYRTVFEQQRRGPLTGTFGFSGAYREYEAAGEEALTPPVNQNGVALFTLQTLDYDWVRFQFGGRYDHTSYDPQGLRSRTFDGLSGAAGVQFRLWPGGVFVANYTHTYRAPALEELYNNGPHPGNATFEIGNAALRRESGDGVDLSLRHQTARVRGAANFYYYGLRDFVYLAPTGEEEDGLPVANYAQNDARFVGMEATLDLGLHPYVWLNLGADAVNAKLTASDTPLPRIPPVRGTVGLDFRYKGLSVKPEVVLADRASRIFPLETPTAGYGVFGIRASYTVAQRHLSHTFALNAFNLGGRLYRNHLSFIKEIAPEIGRGVRFTYLVRFF